MSDLPYNDLNTALRKRFGERVQKITVDAGLTCPNRDGTVGTGGCIYCSSRGSGTGRSYKQSVTEQLESAKSFLAHRYKAKKFIAYFQSFSNTYATVETLRRLYEEALAVEDIVGLAIGTRPDCAGEEVLDLIAEFAERTYVSVEYGLQSIHDRTLKLINRGHTFADFKDAVERTRARGIEFCAHVILGLPGESREDMLATARALGRLGIEAVKIHLLYVIRGTVLHDMYEQGEFQCLTREEYTEIVSDVLAVLPPDMVIHRLTGDPHPGELVAPLWALEKNINLNAIRDTMRLKNIVQGMASR
jgi:radical SAM protein (TIGR01212 family)